MAGRDATTGWQGFRMAEVILFRPRAGSPEEDLDIDLLTAVDAAIRDLRDIAARCRDAGASRQAEDCRRMLEGAYKIALANG
jgi:hypothetical protein